MSRLAGGEGKEEGFPDIAYDMYQYADRYMLGLSSGGGGGWWMKRYSGVQKKLVAVAPS